MSDIADAIRKLFVSFRDSVGGLFDSYATADDLKGVLWLGLVGVVLLLALLVSRAVENRRRKPRAAHLTPCQMCGSDSAGTQPPHGQIQ